MSDETSPTVHAHELWRIPNAEALALVDKLLGPPEVWSASALLNYRLSVDFQVDWKAEVGHWLYAAQSSGFVERLLRPILGERDRPRRNETRDPHDQRHLKLHQYLAVAMVSHYFIGLRWSFVGVDTETGGDIDVDLAVHAPRLYLGGVAGESPRSTHAERRRRKAAQRLNGPSRRVPRSRSGAGPNA